MKNIRSFCLLFLTGLTFTATAQNTINHHPRLRHLSLQQFSHGEPLMEATGLNIDSKMAQKPTVVKQRLIALTNRSSASVTGSATLVDSTRYRYSGSRGSYSNGRSLTLSDYDTAYTYQSSDNFNTPVPLYAKHYDQASNVLADLTYYSNGTLQSNTQNEYYPTGELHITQKTWHSDDNSQNTDFDFNGTQYNMDGQKSYDTTYSFGSVLINYAGTDYHYDNTNRLASSVERYFQNAQTGQPAFTGTRTTWYFYDGNNSKPSRDSLVAEATPAGGASSTTISTDEYIYDNSGNLILQTTYNEPDHSVIVDVNYTYNTEGRTKSVISRNAYSGTLTNYSKTEYDYTSNINTFYAGYSWNAGAGWVEQVKAILTLNSSNMVDSTKDYFMGSLYKFYVQTYNSYDNVVSNITYNFNIFTGASSGYWETHYFYEDYDDNSTGIFNHPQTDYSFALFPNPTNNFLSIQSSKNLKDLSYRITDMSGRIQKEGLLKDMKNTIDVEKLINGIYFIEFSELGKETIISRSFIKK